MHEEFVFYPDDDVYSAVPINGVPKGAVGKFVIYIGEVQSVMRYSQYVSVLKDGAWSFGAHIYSHHIDIKNLRKV